VQQHNAYSLTTAYQYSESYIRTPGSITTLVNAIKCRGRGQKLDAEARGSRS